MLALNWFEVHIPSGPLEFPFEEVGEQDLERPNVPYTTVLRSAERVRYHFTTHPAPLLPTKSVDPRYDPGLISRLIEDSFGDSCLQAGFELRSRGRSRVALRPSLQSAFPDVYQCLDGVSFRCHYFLGDGTVKWGLVLSYAVSQRFVVSLEDDAIQEIAKDVPVQYIHDAQPEEDNADGMPTIGKRSMQLREIRGQKAIVTTSEGNEIELPTTELTVLCRRDTIQQFFSIKGKPKAGDEASRNLMYASLSLTLDNKINRSLARDQLSRALEIVQSNSLSVFRALLPSAYRLSLVLRPLTLEEDLS